MAWADSHTHLVGELGEVQAAGVARMIVVGTDALQSAAAIKAAARTDGAWATVGLHPHDAKNGVDTIVSMLEAGHPEVVAVGECGLDYHYDYSPRPEQRDAFAAQIRLAHERELALVIHTREAWNDTFAILAAEGVPGRTVFHCFTGGADEARRCLDIGAWLSFSGIVTFKAAEDVRAAAALCPLDRLLVETDSPYLTPVPHRGRPNTPAYVPLVGAAIAAVKDIALEDVERSTWAGVEKVFGLAGRAGLQSEDHPA